MALTEMKSAGRSLAAFVYALGLSLYLLLNQRVVVSGDMLAAWLDAFSSGVALLLTVHLLRGIAALPLLFGRAGTKGWIFWRAVWGAMTMLSILCWVPFFAHYCLPLLFALYACAFIRSRLYSIENILFQCALFHLSIARAALMLESYFGLDGRQRIESTSLYALFLSLALIMHSAGFEKLQSPIWRRAEGSIRFLRLRHLIQPVFRRLPELLPQVLLAGMSHAIMVAEIGLLPAMACRPALATPLFVLGGFSISLFVVTDISFIGQLLCLQLAVMGWSFYQGFGVSVSSLNFAGLHGEDVLFAISLLLTCIAIHLPSLSRRLKLSIVQHFASGINSPLKVFTEAHLTDLFMYRFQVSSHGNNLPVAQVFNEDGSPGSLQCWRPRYLQSAMYLIGRLVRKYLNDGVLSIGELGILLDLMACAVPRRAGAGVVQIELLVSRACLELNETANWCRFAQGRFCRQDSAILTFDNECLTLEKRS
jgi:hypothetical protein